VEKQCSWSLRFNFSRQLRNIDGWRVTAVSRFVVPSLESRALFEDEGTAILQNVCNRVNCRHSLTELSSVALLREHQSPPSVWESYQNFEVSVGKTIFSNVKSGGVDIYPWNLQGKYPYINQILFSPKIRPMSPYVINISLLALSYSKMFQPSKDHLQVVRLLHFHSHVNKTCNRCKIRFSEQLSFKGRVPILKSVKTC
jgi:hypothetical protein